MLDEVQPFLFPQRGLEVARPADQTGLALLADAAPKQRLDEDELVAVDQALDLVLRCAGSEHFGGGEIHMLEKLRTIQHPGNLHLVLAIKVLQRLRAGFV